MDLLVDRIFQEWVSRGSAMTYQKKLIDVTASLGWNGLSFTKEKKYTKNRSFCKYTVT